PLVKLTLEDYNNLSPLLKRLEKAEGILVAGRPGAGKSTFISALTEFYLKKKKIVKTLESMRDLQVPPEVSQYADLDGNFEKTADILLLVRPDFTIFDEIRTTEDFKIFSDMRLAGVGMVGVVHASSALDAIQRFIRRVELGILPSVVDTVIFIREGQISEILKLEITVKVPYGIKDQGLARPVIEVSDYISNKLFYEIYEFGSNIVVMPVGKYARKRYYNTQSQNSIDAYYYKASQRGKKSKKSKGKKNKKKDKSYENGFEYEEYLEEYSSPNPFEETTAITSEFENSGDLPEDKEYIDQDLETIESIESIKDKIGVNNKINPNKQKLNELPITNTINTIRFRIVYGQKSLILKSNAIYAGFSVKLFADDEFIAYAQINKKGDIRISKTSSLFHKIDNLIQQGYDIYGVISDSNSIK
ncbi:MAG: ATPase, T2SS/T4P/T4SS family, partial [Promethearchaeota archaeon]